MKKIIFLFLSSALLFACSPQVTTENRTMKVDSVIIKNDTIKRPDIIILRNYEYTCIGTEPFYQIKISEKENLIDFYNPMGQDTIHFPFSKIEMEDGSITFISEDEKANNKIRIKIKDEECSDGMSEKHYHHSTEIILNTKTYKGCAIKFGEIIK